MNLNLKSVPSSKELLSIHKHVSNRQAQVGPTDVPDVGHHANRPYTKLKPFL